MSVGAVIIEVSNKGQAMNEMEAKLYDLMAQVEGNKGGNNEEAMEEIGNILTLLEVFHWEDYKRIVIAKFNVPADHFED
jgi:hypothetical protein